jgi:hypothetical protein
MGMGWKVGGTDGEPNAGPLASVTVPPFFGTSKLSQIFKVPDTGSDLLTLWRRVTPKNTAYPCSAADLSSYDSLSVAVTPAGGAESQLEFVRSIDAAPCSWKKVQYDLSAYRGQVVTLSFTAAGLNDASSTKFDIDGVSVS